MDEVRIQLLISFLTTSYGILGRLYMAYSGCVLPKAENGVQLSFSRGDQVHFKCLVSHMNQSAHLGFLMQTESAACR